MASGRDWLSCGALPAGGRPSRALAAQVEFLGQANQVEILMQRAQRLGQQIARRDRIAHRAAEPADGQRAGHEIIEQNAARALAVPREVFAERQFPAIEHAVLHIRTVMRNISRGQSVICEISRVSGSRSMVKQNVPCGAKERSGAWECTMSLQ